ncbi:TPA: DNA-binding response regulator, partial [Serratia marcescens]
MAEKRILIIEDDMHAAKVLEAYLKRECFAVAKVGDGV